MRYNSITNIYLTKDITLVNIEEICEPKIIPEILKSIAKKNINIDMISHSPSLNGHTNLSFTILTQYKDTILSIISTFEKKYNLFVEVDSNNSKITVFIF